MIENFIVSFIISFSLTFGIAILIRYLQHQYNRAYYAKTMLYSYADIYDILRKLDYGIPKELHTYFNWIDSRDGRRLFTDEDFKIVYAAAVNYMEHRHMPIYLNKVNRKSSFFHEESLKKIIYSSHMTIPRMQLIAIFYGIYFLQEYRANRLDLGDKFNRMVINDLKNYKLIEEECDD